VWLPDKLLVKQDNMPLLETPAALLVVQEHIQQFQSQIAPVVVQESILQELKPHLQQPVFRAQLDISALSPDKLFVKRDNMPQLEPPAALIVVQESILQLQPQIAPVVVQESILQELKPHLQQSVFRAQLEMRALSRDKLFV
jgi:hypothetical protein